jgi:UDP-N-acetylglucosamine--N-acetylmuramyl-(pentapeptide) pyrophosphoryl-undecaprenol N-acetylglucosamine transferase
MSGLRGKGLLSMFKAPLMLLRSVFEANAVLRRHRPAVVVGLGGFVTGPGGVATWLRGLPLVIHEQNAVAGYSNRCLAPLARAVLTAFPSAFPAGGKVSLIGNPVREDIARMPAPAERFAGRSGALRLLVVGGSLGAQRLNAVVPQALAQIAALPAAPVFEVRHQCGEKHLEAARRSYADAGVAAEVSPFIADMAGALAWADLAICRAGALTVAELAVAGLGAVLVPYPHAVDDHQTHNAQFLVDAGAARRVADGDLTPERLTALLCELGADRSRLLAMAESARRVAQPEAARHLLQHILRAGGLS